MGVFSRYGYTEITKNRDPCPAASGLGNQTSGGVLFSSRSTFKQRERKKLAFYGGGVPNMTNISGVPQCNVFSNDFAPGALVLLLFMCEFVIADMMLESIT